uniref:Uncharacterized protein n=1 Tax=Anguilla anguilla TaxID=7936 RepID=A0A0E9VW05_ANGAN
MATVVIQIGWLEMRAEQQAKM